MNSALRATALCAAILTICACSREPQQAAEAPPVADTNPLSAESWIDEVQIKGMQGAESTRAGFAPGEVIELSMAVNDAPAGTAVSPE